MIDLGPRASMTGCLAVAPDIDDDNDRDDAVFPVLVVVPKRDPVNQSSDVTRCSMTNVRIIVVPKQELENQRSDDAGVPKKIPNN